MIEFSRFERQTLSLATLLLVLGTAGRLLLAPAAGEPDWRPGAGHRAASTLDDVRRAVGVGVEEVAEAARPLQAGERIDLNAADEVQLRRLPGIGPARAAAIVADRTANGPFGSVGDLVRVPGIGAASIARWSGAITAGGGNPAVAPSGVGVPGEPSGRKIDLNRAHPNELEQITGIGPVIARRIVTAREQHGPFRSVEELAEIPGIGPKLLEILRSRVRAP